MNRLLSSPLLKNGLFRLASPTRLQQVAHKHNGSAYGSFDKILIANRGEIACRVIRTAKRLGVKTVAVYSEADARSQHVLMADEAYLIGPAPASESYLRGDKIVEVAKQSGAQAIHPGYGFLSENPDFTKACFAAGVEFIGPPVDAIVAMASKSASKNIMIDAGVPVTPGYHGEDQSMERLQAEADAMGYPVLIKAVMGGGGKGMRIVFDPKDLKEAVESCQREAKSSFGDVRVLIERYLTNPRHIEFQIFGDKHGNAVHLYERDCSVQRRHQKVLEEAPAPGMSSELRKKMGDAAVAAARAVGYVGAGTVEFMLDEDESFYFMEMNTRLQVEHPVTEMVTGQDLVEWQLLVAAGHPLPLQQEEIKLNGAALEARVYAENPYNNFLPTTGSLVHMKLPSESDYVRVDTGIVEGDDVSIFYDPMIAKLIVWGKDRDMALHRMIQAIGDYEIVGVTTNMEFLRRVVANGVFARGGVTTGYLGEHGESLTKDLGPSKPSGLSIAALAMVLRDSRNRLKWAAQPRSPWDMDSLVDFRVNHSTVKSIKLIDDGETKEVHIVQNANGTLKVEIDGEINDAEGTIDDEGTLAIRLGNHRYKGRAVFHKDGLYLFANDDDLRYLYHFKIPREGFGPAGAVGGNPSVTAPMPGKIVKVLVEPGQSIRKGDQLIVMEAMKMEHVISSPMDANIGEVFFGEGDQVEDGKALLELVMEE